MTVHLHLKHWLVHRCVVGPSEPCVIEIFFGIVAIFYFQAVIRLDLGQVRNCGLIGLPISGSR